MANMGRNQGRRQQEQDCQDCQTPTEDYGAETPDDIVRVSLLRGGNGDGGEQRRSLVHLLGRYHSVCREPSV